MTMKAMLQIVIFAGFAMAMPAFAHADTLYADLGGQAGINRLVDISVNNYLADERIKAIFDQSNMDRIRMELKDQFCQIAGGPCIYKGHDMVATHKGLHLTNANFNALVEDLQAAMDKCDIPFATQNRFLARLAPYQHEVVTR
jgi:hemoglobin